MLEMLRELKLEPEEAQDDDADNQGNTKSHHKSLMRSPPPISSGAYLEAAARILLTARDYSQKPDGVFSAVEPFGRIPYPAITLQSGANETSGMNEENQLLALLIYAKLAEHKSVKIETNAFGWEQNTVVCAGDYFLFGYGRFGDHILAWQVPVTITPGENTIELDQYNAEVITEF